ncbi:MAG: 2-phospho-L-lactate guanylyltransferase [Pseudomonadota bacterium]|nr:2-phospho-L-lactate guanylyltransferase [Pseudomonadota bacterium]
MNKTLALVPVKALNKAKSRLGPLLSADECANLSLMMLEDVLMAISSAKKVDQIVILTNDFQVIEIANKRGYLVLNDETGELSAELDKAAFKLKTFGANKIVVIPSDVPTINGSDIDRLLTEHSAGLSVCSAYRDGGTNVLICSPPDALRFQFGKNSAKRHVEEAAAADLPAKLIRRAAFGQDIDTPDDLLWLSKQKATINSVEFLLNTGIAARVNQYTVGTSA